MNVLDVKIPWDRIPPEHQDELKKAAIREGVSVDEIFRRRGLQKSEEIQSSQKTSKRKR
jgi:hypothetical protein